MDFFFFFSHFEHSALLLLLLRLGLLLPSVCIYIQMMCIKLTCFHRCFRVVVLLWFALFGCFGSSLEIFAWSYTHTFIQTRVRIHWNRDVSSDMPSTKTSISIQIYTFRLCGTASFNVDWFGVLSWSDTYKIHTHVYAHKITICRSLKSLKISKVIFATKAQYEFWEAIIG